MKFKKSFGDFRTWLWCCAFFLASVGAGFAGVAPPPPAQGSNAIYLGAFNQVPVGSLDADEVNVRNAANMGDTDARNSINGNENLTTTGTDSVAKARMQTGKIIGSQGGRTAAIRSGVNFAVNGQPMEKSELLAAQTGFSGTGGGASSDSAALGGKWGGFLNFVYGRGELEGTGFEAGLNFDVIGVLGGADYRINDNLALGLALGFDRSDGDYTAPASGNVMTDSFSVSGYATYYPTDEIYVDALLNYARNDFDMERNISAVGVNRIANGDTDGNRFGASAAVGYQRASQAATYGPYVQLNYINADVDGFTETGAGSFNLNVRDESVTSFTSVLGLKADYAISMSWGVISPSARVEWEHEFANDSRTLVSAFSANPGLLIGVPTRDPDRDYFNLGIGLAATLPHGISAFLDLEFLVGNSDLQNNTLTFGGRMEF